jgi:hypothetical protein
LKTGALKRKGKIISGELFWCLLFSFALEQRHLPDSRTQFGKTPEDQRKTTKWVFQRGIVAQVRGARGVPHPSSIAFPTSIVSRESSWKQALQEEVDFGRWQ